MAHIKICGLQSLADIVMVNEAKPTYAGFIFAPSTRQITPCLAHQLIKQLKGSIPVGVFVNASMDDIVAISKQSGIRIIQLHGDEDATFIQELKKRSKLPVWKAIRLKQKEDLLGFEAADHLLVDSYQEHCYGGSGKRIHMELLQQLDVSNLIIAGGISKDNVKDILALSPFGIDVSSSIETNGKKDQIKLNAFMKEAGGRYDE